MPTGLTLASKSSVFKTMTCLEEACYSSLICPFQLELASHLVMTRMRLSTFKESSIFTSNVEMRYMHEKMKLCTSFTLPRRLNTKFLSCVGNELDALPHVLILVKIEGLGCFVPAVYET